MSTTHDLTSARWRKSSYSNGGDANCLEIADGYPEVVPVRDSKSPARGALLIPAASWHAFIEALAR